MNVTLRQNVISGESTKMNSPESFLASRILIADPDQSPAACRIRQMRKELEAASRKYSLLEEEFLGLKKVCEAKDAELAHVRESKDAEIVSLQREMKRGVGKIVDSHCSRVEINAEMARLKLEAKKKEKEISLLRSAKRRASSSILQKNKEIAALEENRLFRLRSVYSACAHSSRCCNL